MTRVIFKTWEEWCAHWQSEAERDKDYLPRLRFVKATAQETLLCLLADNGTHFSYSTSRIGAEGKISGSGFHCDVFQAAFYCYRRERMNPESVAIYEKAVADREAAERRRQEAAGSVPIEITSTMYAEGT